VNEIIILNDDDITKWDTYLTEIKSLVEQEPMIPAPVAQILIED
jgi:hypothetical protein